MKKVERLALAGLLVAVGMAVAGYGGVEPVWFAGVELLLFGVGLVGVAGLSDERLAGLPWMPLLVMGLVVVQGLPWPRPLSVAPYETETHLLRLVAYLVAFYWAVLLAAREEGRARLAGGLVAVGTAAGLYGIAQYVSAHSLDYNATGPYVNRNHFAGLLEMVLPLALGWTLAQGRGARSSWREWWTRAEAQKGWLGLVAAVVIFSAIVFSRSRMGLLSTLFALLVMSLGMSWGASPRMSAAGPLAVVLAGAALFSLWVGVDPVVARFGQAFADPGRPPIWADTGRLIREHPWLGTGWGTFPLAYPAVQTAHLGRRVSHAHNDYLEHAAELGVPGALLLWSGIVYLFIRTVRAGLQPGARRERPWLWGCAASLTAILLHSLTDFNLYLPANALVFCLVLGMAYALTRDSAEGLELEVGV